MKWARPTSFAQAAITFAVALVMPGMVSAQDSKPPFWAYTYNPPGFTPPPDDGQPRRVPDSSGSYTVPQTRDQFLAPDWHPGDHPPMPPVVAEGRKPDVYACGFCHRASGPGGPENADIAGLPIAYFVQQMKDYKSGKRSTALPDRIPQAWMISLSKAANDEEIQAAAQYFAAIKPKKVVDVVESETVPKTTVAGWFFVDTKSGEREPIGDRIIELPPTWGASSTAMRACASRPTCRPAASPPAVRWRKSQRSPVLPATARSSPGPTRCRASQAARRPTCFANSMNTATASAPVQRADR